MALGSLAALTPVELVFMGKKKKKSPLDGHARETSLLEEARRYSGLGMCTDRSTWFHRPHLSLAYMGPTLPIAL